MLHAGLDLSRRKVDVCLLSEEGAHLDHYHGLRWTKPLLRRPGYGA
jgi:hypothetical protein